MTTLKTWQPIETAPEGVMILCANMKATLARDWAYVGWIAGGKICGNRMDMPTHWMPLPAAPGAPAAPSAEGVGSGGVVPTDLTDEQIDAIQREWINKGGCGPRGFARAVEAKVRALCATPPTTGEGGAQVVLDAIERAPTAPAGGEAPGDEASDVNQWVLPG